MEEYKNDDGTYTSPRNGKTYKNLKEKILRTNLNESFIKEAFDKILILWSF